MRFRNLVLVGTSHISRESLREVERVIEKENPDIVALELDRPRLYGLLHRKKEGASMSDVRKIGMKGYLFSRIGAWAEKKLGEKTGMKPGEEMVAAFKLARKKKKVIKLIDQEISITLRRLSDSITWKEKWHFIVDLFKAVVLRKKEIEFDIRRVPSGRVIRKLTAKVKKRYPNVYKVLVDERNEFMAGRLASLCLNFPENKIVAVIGAGHEKEILEMVKERLNSKITYSFTAGF